MKVGYLPLFLGFIILPVTAFGLTRTADGATRAAMADARTPVPKIQFAAPVFDFGKVVAGSVVNDDFVFTNAGTAPLIVSGVRPSCGCTTVGKWSARLQPGQTGRIPVRFDSAGFGGAVHKWVMVASNDPDRPKAVLVIEGTVWKPINVSPASAVFTPVAGRSKPETKLIRITNHTGKPLSLSAPASTNRAFAAKLKTVLPGKDFELAVTASPPAGADMVRGLIRIKTNAADVPVIRITALSVVQKRVTVLPGEIQLRRGPLPYAVQAWVTVRNNSGVAGFSVSDPEVNLAGITAVVKEDQAGRVYSVKLTFPAGFDLKPGMRARLKMKTSDRRVPEITVPIFQDR